MPAELLIGGAIIFLGALVQGTVGFGLALTTVPILLLVLPHQMIPPVLVVVGVVNNLFVLADTWRSIRFKEIVPLIIGGVICLPIGAWLLKNLDFSLFKIGVGVIVLTAAVAMLRGWKLKLRPDWWRIAPVGMLSGILGGATALSGPPVILYFAGKDEDKQSFRGNLIAYFTLLNIASVITFWLSGLMPLEVWKTAGLYTIPLVIGSAVGLWIARRVSERIFRLAVLALIICIGLSLIVTNLRF